MCGTKIHILSNLCDAYEKNCQPDECAYVPVSKEENVVSDVMWHMTEKSMLLKSGCKYELIPVYFPIYEKANLGLRFT